VNTRRKGHLTHNNRKEGKLKRSKLAWELPNLKNVIDGKIGGKKGKRDEMRKKKK
jgi:hypothetical protein